MAIDILHDKLKGLLLDSNKQSFAIIIDGAYFTVDNKLVYLKKTYDNQLSVDTLRFFHKTDSNPNVLDNSELLEKIEAKLLSTELYGVSVTTTTDLDRCSYQLDTNMHLIILESNLYNTVRQVVEKGQNFNFFINGVELSSNTSMELINAFKNNALLVYQNLIFSKLSNRFILKLYKVNSFYAIQRVFVPIFIKYNFIYDPFGEDSIIRNLSVYKETISKNRLIKAGDNLNCYMMTHCELCHLFKMNHFIRFTPRLFYRVLIGLIYRDNPNFPNKTSEVMLKSTNSGRENLRNVLVIQEHKEILQASKNLLYSMDSNMDTTKIVSLRDKIRALESYQRVTTLYAECALNYSTLVNFGALNFDNKLTIAQIYSILSEAKL